MTCTDFSGNLGSPRTETSPGFEGIFCGLAAIYTGLAQVLNELAGKTVLPLGAVKKTTE